MFVSGIIDCYYVNMFFVECRCKILDVSVDGFIEGEVIGIMSMMSVLRVFGEGVLISGIVVN